MIEYSGNDNYSNTCMRKQDEDSVAKFEAFIDEVAFAVNRAEEPDWCAVYMTAEDADDKLTVFRDVLRLVQRRL